MSHVHDSAIIQHYLLYTLQNECGNNGDYFHFGWTFYSFFCQLHLFYTCLLVLHLIRHDLMKNQQQKNLREKSNLVNYKEQAVVR